MKKTTAPAHRAENLSELVYQQLKADIFDFKLAPGERFTESEMCEHYQVSRTPIRQALYRLQQEGYVEVGFRRGWQIKPLNFRYYEELYDVRTILEKVAVETLCANPSQASIELEVLKEQWCIAPEHYLKDIKTLSKQDEAFHCALVRAAANQEMARIHKELSEKMRIIRRLDFSKQHRIEATYLEHQTILNYIFEHNTEAALNALVSHIQQSRDEVKKITLHMLDSSQFI